MTDTVPYIVLYRAAALTGLTSNLANTDISEEGFKRIAKAVCDLAQAVHDEASARAKATEAQSNRKY